MMGSEEAIFFLNMMEIQNSRRNVGKFFDGEASQDVELNQLVQAPVFWEGTFDDNMASGAEATEEDFWW